MLSLRYSVSFHAHRYNLCNSALSGEHLRKGVLKIIATDMDVTSGSNDGCTCARRLSPPILHRSLNIHDVSHAYIIRNKITTANKPSRPLQVIKDIPARLGVRLKYVMSLERNTSTSVLYSIETLSN